jgi:hypothetical protein
MSYQNFDATSESWRSDETTQNMVYWNFDAKCEIVGKMQQHKIM